MKRADPFGLVLRVGSVQQVDLPEPGQAVKDVAPETQKRARLRAVRRRRRHWEGCDVQGDLRLVNEKLVEAHRGLTSSWPVPTTCEARPTEESLIMSFKAAAACPPLRCPPGEYPNRWPPAHYREQRLARPAPVALLSEPVAVATLGGPRAARGDVGRRGCSFWWFSGQPGPFAGRDSPGRRLGGRYVGRGVVARGRPRSAAALLRWVVGLGGRCRRRPARRRLHR